MTRWTELTLAGLALTGIVEAQDGAATARPPLDDADFATWRERILITDAELGWARLPWYVTYHEGLEQAGVEGKPLLLWVMNGHPLGCT
jgi:hypothetical protein